MLVSGSRTISKARGASREPSSLPWESAERRAESGLMGGNAWARPKAASHEPRMFLTADYADHADILGSEVPVDLRPAHA